MHTEKNLLGMFTHRVNTCSKDAAERGEPTVNKANKRSLLEITQSI